MNQEQLLAQREELAREYHLGELELYRTPMTFKGWTIFLGGLVAFFLLFFLAIAYFSGNLIGNLPSVGIILLAVLGGLVIGYIGTYFTYYSVYIYTNGLIYLNWQRSGVARWEEIGGGRPATW